jgi:hypothetical protein
MKSCQKDTILIIVFISQFWKRRLRDVVFAMHISWLSVEGAGTYAISPSQTRVSYFDRTLISFLLKSYGMR